MLFRHPLIAGQTLRSLLTTFGPMNPERAVAIVEQVAAALDAVRGHRLIHRDVRPENILVTADDAAYLLGFGVADPELSAPRPTAAPMPTRRPSGSTTSRRAAAPTCIRLPAC
ncbi:serine/threonine-protein kinase pknE [Mycobacterium xenopi 3993]|nr:serine/threonine-protein kinase pknE [Mycobacterium xenopi 3993]